MDKIETTWICPRCSAEVASGLMNYANHRCEEDRPSESIAAHQREVEIQRIAEQEDAIWTRLFTRLSQEEKNEYILLSMSGQVTYTGRGLMVLMGMGAMERLLQFKADMIMKYI